MGVYDGKGLPAKAAKHHEHDPGLSREEMRTHYAAWAIVSSPLILSHDINNETIMDTIWPIICEPLPNACPLRPRPPPAPRGTRARTHAPAIPATS